MKPIYGSLIYLSALFMLPFLNKTSLGMFALGRKLVSAWQECYEKCDWVGWKEVESER